VDPIREFLSLYEQATRLLGEDAAAMVLSTVDSDGRPSSRFVLLRGVDDHGFMFFTNLGSRKARALSGQPGVALCFYWAPLGKQVRIEGVATGVTANEADAYFASRPRAHQVSAWASAQSEKLPSRDLLEERVREAEARFAGQPVPRPPFWSGFRVRPDRIEFWTRMPNRLHERVLYERDGGSWAVSSLYP
jgi:pyridoxamine 5'-phosphate oxidase